MNQHRLSADSTEGQCRLAPLAFCVQDSKQLFDHCVRLMFRLHANLSNDLLKGHRERFEIIFRQLKHFYMQVINISYFNDLSPLLMLPAFLPIFDEFLMILN